MHKVIRTIRGREYEYEEESYRVPGEKNPRKRSRYIGPVNPIHRKRRKGLIGVIDGLVRNRQPWEETEAEQKARIAEEESRRKIQDTINARLSRSMTLDRMREVVDLQQALRGTREELMTAERNLFSDLPEGLAPSVNADSATSLPEDIRSADNSSAPSED